MVTKNPVSYVKNLVDGAKVDSSVVQVIACVGLALVEELYVEDVFRCPCIEDRSTITGILGVDAFNTLYGAMFFVLPFSCLYILGLAQNKKLWKLFTGMCKHSDDGSNEDQSTVSKYRKKMKNCLRASFCCCCCCEDTFKKNICKGWLANLQALYVASAWFTIALFDGDYLACALTPEPYNKTCDEVKGLTNDQLPFSNEYEKNKEDSQLIGLGTGTLTLLLYLAWKCVKKCYFTNEDDDDTNYEQKIVLKDLYILGDEKINESVKEKLEEEVKTIFSDVNEFKFFKDTKTKIKKRFEKIKEKQENPPPNPDPPQTAIAGGSGHVDIALTNV